MTPSTSARRCDHQPLPQRLHRRVNAYLDWRKRGRPLYGRPGGSAFLVLFVTPMFASLVRPDDTSRVPALWLIGAMLVGLVAASPAMIKHRRERKRWQANPPPPTEEPAEADSSVRGST